MQSTHILVFMRHRVRALLLVQRCCCRGRLAGNNSEKRLASDLTHAQSVLRHVTS